MLKPMNKYIFARVSTCWLVFIPTQWVALSRSCTNHMCWSTNHISQAPCFRHGLPNPCLMQSATPSHQCFGVTFIKTAWLLSQGFSTTLDIKKLWSSLGEALRSSVRQPFYHLKTKSPCDTARKRSDHGPATYQKLVQSNLKSTLFHSTRCLQWKAGVQA